MIGRICPDYLLYIFWHPICCAIGRLDLQIVTDWTIYSVNRCCSCQLYNRHASVKFGSFPFSLYFLQLAAEYAEKELFPSLMRKLVQAKERQGTPSSASKNEETRILLAEFSKVITEEILHLDTNILSVAKASRDLSGMSPYAFPLLTACHISGNFVFCHHSIKYRSFHQNFVAFFKAVAFIF